MNLRVILTLLVATGLVVGCQSSVPGTGGEAPANPASADAGVEGGVLGLRAFVTRAGYPGNLTAEAKKTSGLDAADALCQTAADGASLGARFVAYLSMGAIDAKARIKDDGPFYLVDGHTLAYDNVAAIGGGAKNDVLDEAGGKPLDSPNFWTGSTPAGLASGVDCNGWTSSSIMSDGSIASRFGDSEYDLACESHYRLLCLEQPGSAVAVPEKHVFVSSQRLIGAMVASGSPLTAADAHCQSAATEAGVSGTFVAWLSARVSGKVMRAPERITDARYVMLDGTAVFGSKKELVNGPAVPIDINEFGAKVPEETMVWTGTLKNGAPATTYTCQNWTESGEWGIAGHVHASGSFGPTELWTGPETESPGTYSNCSEAMSLYCFER